MAVSLSVTDAGGGSVNVSYSTTAENGLHRSGGFCNISWATGSTALAGPSGSTTLFVGYNSTVSATAGITYLNNSDNTFNHQEQTSGSTTTGPAPSNPPPPPPPAPSATGSITSTGAASFSWAAVTATGYRVLRNGTVLVASTTATSITDTVPAGSAYAYTVQAFNTGSGTSYSPASNTVTLSVPFAPTLTGPTNSATLDRSITQRFVWQFASPDTTDTQSQFALQYRPSSGASPWVSVTGATPNTYADIDPNTFASATSYEWQVRTLGQRGAWGPWSASSFFTAVTPPPGPIITAPTNGSTVGTAQATVTWSIAAQSLFQVRRVADLNGNPDTTTVYSDSGPTPDTITRSYDLPFPVNNRTEHIQVRVQTNGFWSPWTDVRVLVSYTQPPVASVTLTPNSATASITVTFTIPDRSGTQPVATYVDVYRSTDDGPLERIGFSLPTGAPFVDWTPASGTEYAYMVRVFGNNGTSSDSQLTSVAVPTNVHTSAGIDPYNGGGYLDGY